MSLAEVTSTSTRDPTPRPVWKNLHRTAPLTSTTSSVRHVIALRRTRDVQVQHGTESTF